MQKALFILGELNNDDLNWLLQKGRKRLIHTDNILIHEGENINALYIVLEGSFSVLLESLDSKHLAKIYQGEVVGEISFIDTRPPLATVKALEDSLVLEIPRIDLMARLRRDQSFASRFYRGILLCLADRMRGTVRRLGYGFDLEDMNKVQEDPNANLVENLDLAQAKFNWLLKTLKT